MLASHYQLVKRSLAATQPTISFPQNIIQLKPALRIGQPLGGIKFDAAVPRWLLRKL